MNVAFDPWIPVVTTSGTPYLASLCAALTESENFADLSVRPHERVSLMRLFLCVAHAALNGPKDYSQWCEVPRLMPEAARKYLTDWRESFELFDKEKPWLQVKDLEGFEKSKENHRNTSPVAFLDSELATGNTSTLHDHLGSIGKRMVDPARLALNLLTFQNFSSGGGSPVAQWKGKKTSQVGNPDAPCLSQSMAHCLLRGRSLAETIHLNLPTQERIGMVYRTFSLDRKRNKDVFDQVKMGKPVWERFPSSPDDLEAIANATRTYVGRLVPVSRWVHLIESSDRMYCCNGFKYDTYKDGFPAEPTAAVRLVKRRDKKGVESLERRVVGISPSKATWRELSALLTKRAADGLGGPLAVENVPHDMAYDFHICAMTRDQASMDIGVESVFHLSPGFESSVAIYSAEVEMAEKTSRRIREAIEAYRTIIDSDWISRINRTDPRDQGKLRNRLAQNALLFYWTAVEENLPLLIVHIDSLGTDAAMPTRQAWRKMLFMNARKAYQIACGQETPRQMRAFAQGWERLTAWKNGIEDVTLIKEDEE